MKIRKARPSDSPIIRDIISPLVVDRKSTSRSGFIEYPVPSADEYARRISVTEFFYVAEEGEPIAFISGYNDSAMSILNMGNPLTNHILRIGEKPFIYADELAVSSEHQHRGIGMALIGALILSASDAKYQRMYCATAHAPWKNEMSTRYFTKLGANPIGEFSAGGLTFGVYELLLR